MAVFWEKKYCNHRIPADRVSLQMPDLSWPGWGIVVSVLLAVIPALMRFRDMLTRLKNLITEILGVIVLMSGLFLFVEAVPQWSQIQAEIAQLSANSTPGLDEHVQTLYTLYFGAISLMMLGGLLTLFGILGRMTPTSKKK